MLFILSLIVVGMIVGALARLALPGKDPMTIWQTLLIGVAGALIGGLISWALFGRGAGFALSILCATVIVYFVRRSRGGSLTDPGRPPIR